ncbi:middle operon regulator [Microcystis phage Mwe-Yong1]|nr:middle operon regulator [Microcystis phage Mwe-Yong1]
MTDLQTPEHLQPYVDVLGVDRALALFLALGGSQIYLPKKSGTGTLAAQVIGPDQVERLAEWFGPGYIKVPVARQWIAAVLRAQGKSDNEIARTVRADVETVRRWLGAKSAAEQLKLPL